jgi:carboxypeptidase C (cathepsin A)
MPTLHSRFLIATFSLLPVLSAFGDEKDKEDKNPDPLLKTEPTEAEVTIAGEIINYTVQTNTLTLKNDEGEDQASIFHVTYLRQGQEDSSERPVTFAFNGGPGSSAVWLHLGALGPKLVPTSPDGTEALTPPITLEDNPHSILDVTDLVFIDPVSTGYSRAEDNKKSNQFHGLEGDIESVGDFIRRWTTENQRWGSPKFLLGESYGGIRAAGLAEHLQSRYGMSLNGVVLLSSLLDFRTLQSSNGDYLQNLVYLPAYAAVAHHHGKIDRDREELLAEARAFANGPYASALFAGNTLGQAELENLANKLSELTAIPTELWVETKLRLSPSRFRRELLRDSEKVIGRFDGRVAWDQHTSDSDWPTYDPSYAVAYGAFSTAMLAYLTDDLGANQVAMPYEILTGKVRPWRWDAENSIVNVSNRIQSALRDNPKLQILVMGGLTDLATPPAGIEYSLSQLVDLPKAAQDNIQLNYYDAGHMFYLNEPDLVKMRKDLVQFFQEASPSSK